MSIPEDLKRSMSSIINYQIETMKLLSQEQCSMSDFTIQTIQYLSQKIYEKLKCQQESYNFDYTHIETELQHQQALNRTLLKKHLQDKQFQKNLEEEVAKYKLEINKLSSQMVKNTFLLKNQQRKGQERILTNKNSSLVKTTRKINKILPERESFDLLQIGHVQNNIGIIYGQRQSKTFRCLRKKSEDFTSKLQRKSLFKPYLQ